MQFAKEKMNEILKNHELWLRGCGGERANFRETDLREADFREANLSGADLSGASLSGADLSGADIDYASWPMWCGSLFVKADSKIVIQLLYHALRLAKNSDIDEELKNVLFSRKLIDQANRFHRVEECGKIILEE